MTIFMSVRVICMILKTIYGLNNSVKTFRRDLLRSFPAMGCRIINTDPYIYFKWEEMGLLVWLSWIDGFEFFWRDNGADDSRNKMMKLFYCEDVWNIYEYVGCNINGNDDFTFPHTFMFQNFSYVAIPGKTLTKSMEEYVGPPKETTQFYKGLEKFLQIIRLSRT